MSGKLDYILVAQQNSQSQIIGWQFLPFGVDKPSSAVVAIYRSDVEHGDYEQIAKISAERGWYEDTDAELNNRWESPFYFLSLRIGTEEIDYPPVRVNGERDVMSSSLIRHMNTYLRSAGIPVLVYQYLNSGERCVNCWDSVLQKSTLSACPTCFGTGFEQGYHAPVLTLASLGVEGKQNLVGERTEQEITIDMLFSNYPVLRPRDIIYEVDAGRRYRVQQVLPSEKHRTLVNQSALGYALQPTDVEQDLPIPDITKLVPVLRRKQAAHRKVSSSDGTSFDDDKFEHIKY